ncbi:MAG TPA: hypothetical protein VH092_38620, partial [Urbifossiella sp.]|nr:hypothetical protein [Urbifossiella sp.]
MTDPAEPGGDRPLLLPPEVAPSDDLTWAARRMPPDPGSPYDGDPAFDRCFDRLARALHRRDHPHVLLVAERGVGPAAVLAETARRAARDPAGVLGGRHFLRVDGRFVPPD